MHRPWRYRYRNLHISPQLVMTANFSRMTLIASGNNRSVMLNQYTTTTLDNMKNNLARVNSTELSNSGCRNTSRLTDRNPFEYFFHLRWRRFWLLWGKKHLSNLSQVDWYWFFDEVIDGTKLLLTIIKLFETRSNSDQTLFEIYQREKVRRIFCMILHWPFPMPLTACNSILIRWPGLSFANLNTILGFVS